MASRWKLRLFPQCGFTLQLPCLLISGILLISCWLIQTGDSQLLESCSDRPTGCDLFCRYGYGRGFNGACICLCYDPCQGKSCGSDETCLVKQIGKQFIGLCTSAIEDCLPGVAVSQCFVSPCVLSFCSQNSSLTCVPDYCGGCFAHYYEINGTEVTKACMPVRQPLGPVTKPGTCPNLEEGFCHNECETDADCIGDRKCCANDCGRICAPPATEKVGQCPQPGLIPVQTCRSECREDAECSGVQKCCTNGCANICSFPEQTTECVHIRAAVERLPAHTLANGYKPDCRDDGRFKQIQCDREFCWCVDRLGQEKFGTKLQVIAGSPNCNGGRTCPSDFREEGGNICARTRKCPHGYLTDAAGCPLPDCPCKDICTNVQCPNTFETCQLVEPACSSPPCKPVPRCLLNPCPNGKPLNLPHNGVTALCTNTPECGPSHWCHLIGYSGFGFCCNTPASAVRPGSCPLVQPGAGGHCTEECRVDADCPHDQKCCYNGCGLSCMAVRGVGPPVKDGTCPTVTPSSAFGEACITMCNHDGDCTGRQKCCQVGCSVRCESPTENGNGNAIGGGNPGIPPLPGGNTVSAQLDRKLGDCPAVPSIPESSRVCAQACQTDDSCPSVRKCCSNGCGTQCVYPAVATACIQAAVSVEILFPSNPPWVPKCRQDGLFEQIQCAANGIPCWCVNREGLEVPATRTLNGSPNCQQPSSRCANESCGLRCPFGRELDPAGCEICTCRNPCSLIQCRRPFEICMVKAVDCYDPTHCPAQPRCVANVCPEGEPFRGQRSGELFQCDPGRPCPSGLWCHNVGYEGMGMCCPAPEPRINSGSCGIVAPSLVPSPGLCNLGCKQDEHCPSGLKCCYNGCGLSCIQPVAGLNEEKPGTCHSNIPDTNITKMCIRQCSGDGNCPDSEKCCPLGCSFVCAAPSNETEDGKSCIPGQNTVNRPQILSATPPPPALQPQPPPRFTPPPVFTKPGTCPAYDKNRRHSTGCFTDISECSTDQQCQGIKKCCKDGCRRYCTYADQTTSCLHFKAALENIAEGAPEVPPPFAPDCNGTGAFEPVQCDEAHQVCWCVSPVGKEVPGTRLPSSRGRPNCAAPRPCPPLQGCTETSCTFGLDLDIAGCPTCSCFNPCNKVRCALPFQICLLEEVRCTSSPCPPVPRCVPNSCPQGGPLVSSVTFSAISCSSNVQCPQGTAFCHIYTAGRGYCCPPPQPQTRPGSCPAIPAGVKGPCTLGCQRDDACQPNMKCCFNGCGMECLPSSADPGSTKPGNCPVQQNALQQRGSCDQRCRDDTSCPDLQKCCVIGCSRLCVLPNGLAGTQAKTKLGECQRVPAVPRHLCPAGQRTECSSDAECPGIRKCCHDGCTQRCNFAAITTGCLHRLAATEILSQIPGPSSVPLPNCRLDGQFDQIQCQRNNGACWCVDSAGMEIPGTRVQGGQSPNCQNPRQCPPKFCTLNCPLGHKMDGNGCEQCACFDPCERITCPFQYQVCRLMPVDCFTEPCLAVPKCVVNPCPAGEPLRDSTSWEVRLCNSTSFGNCPGGYFCNRFGFESDQGFCCLGNGPQRRPVDNCPTVPLAIGQGDRNLCTQRCKTHDDCSNNRLCCFNGCGMSCLDKPGSDRQIVSGGSNGQEVTRPEIRPVVSGGNSAKIGSCPSNPLSNPGCVSECNDDSGCSGYQKCCPYGCGRKCQLPYNTTACIHWRTSMQELTGLYVPECQANGDFTKVQCDAVQGQCWCVDTKSGIEIPGTRSGGQPNCEVKSFCPSTCSLQCQHGLVLDNRGCPLNGNCECRDPCKGIACPKTDHLCFVRKINCIGKPCPPVPKCKPNPCRNRPPARDSVTGLPMQCSGIFTNECGPQYTCKLIPGERNNGLCCSSDGVENTAEKIGTCPREVPSLRTKGCHQECNGDVNCPGTRKCCSYGCAKACISPENGSNCLNLKAAIEAIVSKQRQNPPTGLSSLFQPSCDSRSGLFNPIQCDSLTGACWCVDTITGIEVYGTRKPGQSASCGARQVCSIACNERDVICPFGFKVDQQGCPADSTCRCRNPCEEVSCSRGEVCLLKEVRCLQPPCFPVPVCRANPCANGAVPATEPRTHAMFNCRSDGSRNCPGGFVCAGQDTENDGVCCPLQSGGNSIVPHGNTGSGQISYACPHGNPFSLGTDGIGKPLPCSKSSHTCPSTHYCLLQPQDPSSGICCVRQNYVCNLRPDTGPCRQQQQAKWYFDPVQRKCIKFVYGGCRGNLNNFGSEVECQRFCKSSSPHSTNKPIKPGSADFPSNDDGGKSERVQMGFSLSGPLLGDAQRRDFVSLIRSYISRSYGPQESQVTNLKLSKDNTVQFAVAGPNSRIYADAISKAVSESRFRVRYGSSEYRAEPQTMFYEPIKKQPLSNEDSPNSAFLGLVISCATFGFIFLLMLIVAVVIVHRRKKNKQTPSNSTGTPIPYQNPVYISSNGSEVSRPILDTATDHITSRSLPRRKFSMDDMDSIARVNGYYPSNTWRSNAAAINGTTNRGDTQLYY